MPEPTLSADSGDLRERILAASVELLEEQGVGGLSMREVARRAGVSHQAPYHHFADREAILAAIAEDGFRRLAESLEAASSDPKRSLPERFQGCGSAYVRFACANPAHFRVMFRPELVRLDRYPDCEAQGDRAFAYLVRLVREMVEAGMPDEPNQAAVTAAVWSAVHGLSCLLIDGPLAKKFPGTGPESAIPSVTSALTRFFTVDLASQPRKPRLRAKKRS